MIEVEKKYRLDEAQEAILLKDAVFLKETTNKDTYFDTSAYELTTQDYWLRKRNGSFELKLRLHELGHGLGGTSYDEIEDEQRIREFLNLDTSLPMEPALEQAGYMPFVTLTKQRRSYTHGTFRIDLDECDFDYRVAEIELLLEDGDDRMEAMIQIDEFAESIGLDTTPVRGKIIEYLYRFDKHHYQALLDAGVI